MITIGGFKCSESSPFKAIGFVPCGPHLNAQKVLEL